VTGVSHSIYFLEGDSCVSAFMRTCMLFFVRLCVCVCVPCACNMPCGCRIENLGVRHLFDYFLGGRLFFLCGGRLFLLRGGEDTANGVIPANEEWTRANTLTHCPHEQ